MAILGAPFGSENPEYLMTDFTFWCPAFRNYCNTQEGETMFGNLYPIADSKILYSIFGVDWKYAMSLCIAHYAVIIGRQTMTPASDSLASIVESTSTSGVISSATVGQFSKTFDLDRSFANTGDAIWWNSTPYGQELYNLFKSKPNLTMVVVTSNDIPAR